MSVPGRTTLIFNTVEVWRTRKNVTRVRGGTNSLYSEGRSLRTRKDDFELLPFQSHFHRTLPSSFSGMSASRRLQN